MVNMNSITTFAFGLALICPLCSAQSNPFGPPGHFSPFNPTRDPCFDATNNLSGKHSNYVSMIRPSQLADVTVLPQHKYQVLEQCLYYQLQRKTDDEYRKPSALFLLPPGKDRKTNVTIVVKDTVVQNLWLVTFVN